MRRRSGGGCLGHASRRCARANSRTKASYRLAWLPLSPDPASRFDDPEPREPSAPAPAPTPAEELSLPRPPREPFDDDCAAPEGSSSARLGSSERLERRASRSDDFDGLDGF
eukprot:324426_1